MSRLLERFSILVIVLIAAALRILPIGVGSYAWDEARISYDALRVARGGEFLLFGQGSSVGVPFFPASVWAFVPPYLASPDPLIAVLYVALINVAMVFGVWGLARRWSPAAGLAAALFIAVNPYAVFYARSIWQPNLLAPLMLAWLIAAYHGATSTGRARSIGIAAAVLIGGLSVQIHFAGAALIPLTLYALIRFKWWRSLVPVLIGGAVVLIAALPYGYALLTEPEIITRAQSVTGSGLTLDLSAAGHALRMALGWDWVYLGGGEGDTIGRSVRMAAVSAVLLILGTFALIRLLRRPVSPGRTLAELTFAALIASPLLFLAHTSPVLPHYELVTLPASALIVGLSMTLIPRRIWQIGIGAAVMILAIVWSAQAAITLDTASRVRPVNSALSSILRESRDAALSAAESGDPVLFFTHGDDPLIDGEVTVFTTLLWTYPHRVLNGDNLMILPPYPSVILSTLAPIQAWEEVVASGLAVDVREYPRRDGALPFMAIRYDGAADPQGFTPLDPVIFADGSQLEGWRVRWVGNRWRVSTLWRVTGDLPDEPIQQFTHLYRAGDNVNAAPYLGSDVALSVHTWEIGNRVIVMADFFDVPPGEGYTLAVGHYRLSDGARIPLQDGADRLLIEGVQVEEVP